jgi:Spy/CpxP family protein refolding chaperone
MKTQKFKKVSLIVIAALMITGSSMYAQQGRNYSRQAQGMKEKQSCQMIPDLTEEQETKMKALRLKQTKEMTAFKNQMNELRAKKQTLMSADDSDLKEVNAVIDQMTDIHNKMMKASAKHHKVVRNLLTDEQKIIFDSKPMHRKGHARGMRHSHDSRRARGNMNRSM